MFIVLSGREGNFMIRQKRSEKKITKEYLKTKLKGSTMVLWIIIGFFFGTSIGRLAFGQEQNDIIQLTFVYSSEKATWIGETQGEFEEYWNSKMENNPDLKPISLDFQPYGSGSSLIALLNGEIKPVIWSPASNIWIPMLNTKWQDMTNQEEKIITNYSRCIYSPIVLATWEEFNETHNIRGINDLHDYIVEHPGEIKMAHTDPRSSNSGFMATIMMVSSKLNMPPDEINISNISQSSLIDWMEEIEGSAVQYGESTGFLGRYMRDNGPQELGVAFLYENLVKDYSPQAEKNFGQKLVSIYPEEGALFSDHPFCILNSDWVSDEQRYVAKDYIEFISQKNMIEKAIRTGFRPINSTLLEDPEIYNTYNTSFNQEYGVTSNPEIIKELLAPEDGNVIARIPDLWLMTRATRT